MVIPNTLISFMMDFMTFVLRQISLSTASISAKAKLWLVILLVQSALLITFEEAKAQLMPQDQGQPLDTLLARSYRLFDNNVLLKPSSQARILSIIRYVNLITAEKATPTEVTQWAKAQIQHGLFYIRTSHLDSAAVVLKSAMPHQQLLPPRYQFSLLMQQNLVASSQGDYPMAFKHAQEGYHIGQRNRDDRYQAEALREMAYALGWFGRLEEVKRYYKLSYQYALKSKEPKLIIFTLLNMSDIYSRNNGLDSASIMLNTCMEISIKKADSLYLFDIMGALADVEIKRGNPAKALTILAPLDDPNKWSQINYNRFKLTQVDAYQSLGELNKAIQIALSQCKQMAGLGLRTERLSWLYRLYRLYSDAGDYRLAFKYVVQHQELKDTLLNLNQSEQITLAEKKYQVSQKQAENDLLNYELRTQKQYQLFGGIIVGLIILSGAVIVFAANWQRSLVTAKAQRLGAELQLSQMELANQQQASEVARLKEEALQQEQALLEESLERSRKELASKTAFMIRKNQLLTAIKEQADAANRLPKHLRDLIDKLDGILDEEDDWNSFKRHFEEVHPDFFSRLLALSPALTPNDLRILAYHKMKLSTKEMAYMTSVAEGSIRNIRLRIRKKLNIGDLDLGIWVEGV